MKKFLKVVGGLAVLAGISYLVINKCREEKAKLDFVETEETEFTPEEILEGEEELEECCDCGCEEEAAEDCTCECHNEETATVVEEVKETKTKSKKTK